jgi:hypothetical protein
VTLTALTCRRLYTRDCLLSDFLFLQGVPKKTARLGSDGYCKQPHFSWEVDDAPRSMLPAVQTPQSSHEHDYTSIQACSIERQLYPTVAGRFSVLPWAWLKRLACVSANAERAAELSRGCFTCWGLSSRQGFCDHEAGPWPEEDARLLRLSQPCSNVRNKGRLAGQRRSEGGKGDGSRADAASRWSLAGSVEDGACPVQVELQHR